MLTINGPARPLIHNRLSCALDKLDFRNGKVAWAIVLGYFEHFIMQLGRESLHVCLSDPLGCGSQL